LVALAVAVALLALALPAPLSTAGLIVSGLLFGLAAARALAGVVRRRDPYSLELLREMDEQARDPLPELEEIDPGDEAVSCPSCGSVYPAEYGLCPECGRSQYR
jgi:hypothetical protein